MALFINQNIMALNVARNLSNSFIDLTTGSQRLGSRLADTGSAQQPSGETVASGSPEQTGGALLNTSDAGAGASQAATGQGAQSADPQANALLSVPQGMASAPLMNMSATSSQNSADPNMADAAQNSLQDLSRLQALAQNGIAALARSSAGSIAEPGQNLGALVNTSDVGSGLVKDANQAILDQPAPNWSQSALPAGMQMAERMGLFKTDIGTLETLLFK